jgi:DNA-binding transcriptional LysR family regulator
LLLLSSAMADLGVGIAHEWMVRKQLLEGSLVRVLGNYTANPRPGDADLYAVFPSSRWMSKTVRAFVDFLIETFAEVSGPENEFPGAL